jgi:hypothetical protein
VLGEPLAINGVPRLFVAAGICYPTVLSNGHIRHNTKQVANYRLMHVSIHTPIMSLESRWDNNTKSTMFWYVTPCGPGRSQLSFRWNCTASEENVWTEEAGRTRGRDKCMARSFITCEMIVACITHGRDEKRMRTFSSKS